MKKKMLTSNGDKIINLFFWIKTTNKSKKSKQKIINHRLSTAKKKVKVNKESILIINFFLLQARVVEKASCYTA